MHSSRALALAALIFTMVIWGSTFVVTKAAAEEVPVFALSFLRFFIAALVLVPLAAWRTGLKPSPRMTRGVLTGMAVTGMVLFVIGFNYGLIFASATQGALIYAVSPAAIAVAAVMFLKERPSRKRIVGIVLSMIGVALVIVGSDADPSSPRPLLGAACMLATVLVWAGYTVLAKRLETEDQLLVITWVTLIAMLMLLPFAAIEWRVASYPAPSAQALGGVVFLGVAASALAYVAYGYSLRHLDATLVGVFTNLDPIIGVATAVVLLGETLHAGHLIGGAIALAGMWLASTSDGNGREA